jgi:cytochrome b561
MQFKNTNNRYGGLSIGLHWLMFFLIVGIYGCMELHEFYPRGSDIRQGLKHWHFMLGLSVFFLVWLRLLAKVWQVSPDISPDITKWQKLAAKGSHLVLYLFMLGMPIGGWLILSGEGENIPFFGLSMPPLMSENKDLAETIEDIHKLVGNIGYALIGLHAAVALFHHYIQKDNTLTRMLPGKD